MRKTGESANATHRLGFVSVMTIRHVTIDGDWSCHDQLNRLILANAERRAGNGDLAGMVGNQSVETSLQVQGGLAGYDLVRILWNGIVDAVLTIVAEMESAAWQRGLWRHCYCSCYLQLVGATDIARRVRIISD